MERMMSEIEELREELAEARAELERVYDDRGDMTARIAYFGPMHGESVRRLQITSETDGDILSVAEQEHRSGQRLLWFEVMQIRGYGSHRLASTYLTPTEATSLRDLLTAYVEAAHSATEGKSDG
jgi:hypothetical protein